MRDYPQMPLPDSSQACAGPPAAHVPTCCPQDPVHRLTGLRVLLIEDDQGVAEAVARLVARHGAAALAASSLEQAREVLGQSPPDVVLLDLEMAEGFGLSLAPHLHESRTAFIVYTGHARLHLEACLRAGALDVLEKPAGSEEIVSAVWAGAGRTGYLRRRFGSAVPHADRPSARLPAISPPEGYALMDDLLCRVERAGRRNRCDDRIHSPGGSSRLVVVALLSTLGLGRQEISHVTRTSISNIRRILDLLRDRVGWRSPNDGMRWYLFQQRIDTEAFLSKWLRDPDLLDRAALVLKPEGKKASMNSP